MLSRRSRILSLAVDQRSQHLCYLELYQGEHNILVSLSEYFYGTCVERVGVYIDELNLLFLSPFHVRSWEIMLQDIYHRIILGCIPGSVPSLSLACPCCCSLGFVNLGQPVALLDVNVTADNQMARDAPHAELQAPSMSATLQVDVTKEWCG